MHGICHLGDVLAEFDSVDLAQAALDSGKYPQDSVVEELTYCSSCGEEAGRIPVSMLDTFGCQRRGCQY